MTAVSGPRRRVSKEIAARLIGARGLPIGLRIWALVARRPIDSLAILTAGVASIVIIINAVFLQSGFRQGTDQSEGLGRVLINRSAVSAVGQSGHWSRHRRMTESDPQQTSDRKMRPHRTSRPLDVTMYSLPMLADRPSDHGSNR
jgi:hypothetical protein